MLSAGCRRPCFGTSSWTPAPPPAAPGEQIIKREERDADAMDGRRRPHHLLSHVLIAENPEARFLDGPLEIVERRHVRYRPALEPTPQVPCLPGAQAPGWKEHILDDQPSAGLENATHLREELGLALCVAHRLLGVGLVEGTVGEVRLQVALDGEGHAFRNVAFRIALLRQFNLVLHEADGLHLNAVSLSKPDRRAADPTASVQNHIAVLELERFGNPAVLVQQRCIPVPRAVLPEPVVHRQRLLVRPELVVGRLHLVVVVPSLIDAGRGHSRAFPMRTNGSHSMNSPSITRLVSISLSIVWLGLR